MQKDQIQTVQYLDNLHEQLVGFEVIIAFLKAFTDSFCLISKGTKSQIAQPRKAIVLAILNTDLTRVQLRTRLIT